MSSIYLPDFFEALNARYSFTLDGAATTENALLPIYSTESAPISWKYQRVFCNPPWSNVRPFVELAPDAEFACLLVPARTNCKWFHRALALGAKPDYWQGKLNFGGPFNSPIDCMLLLWKCAGYGETGETRGMGEQSELGSSQPSNLTTAGSSPADQHQVWQLGSQHAGAPGRNTPATFQPDPASDCQFSHEQMDCGEGPIPSSQSSET